VVISAGDRETHSQHSVVRLATEPASLQRRIQRTASANNIHQVLVCPSHPSPLKRTAAVFPSHMVHALPPPRVQSHTGGSLVRSSSATPRVFSARHVASTMACANKSGPAVAHFRRRAPVLTPPYRSSTRIITSRSPSSARSTHGSEPPLQASMQSPSNSSLTSSPAVRSVGASPGWGWPSSLEEEMGETSSRRQHLRCEIHRVRQELETLYDWFQRSGAGQIEDDVYR